MKQTLSNTKKSLGRVWFRYFQLYGVTGKLATACTDIGWTQTNVDAYARGHYHLVNQQMAMSQTYRTQEIWNGWPATPQWQDLGKRPGHKCMLVKRRGKCKGTGQELWH